MNACPTCEPTHNRDVRERGHCDCSCHRDSARQAKRAAKLAAQAGRDQEYVAKVNDARAANGMKPLSPEQARRAVASMRALQRTVRKDTR